MGSDWSWELRIASLAEPELRELYAMAAERDLRPQRPDGLINLLTNEDTDLRTVTDPEEAIAGLATGEEHGEFWTGPDVGVYLAWQNGTLVWALDSVYRDRRPGPEADPFRDLHARLTSLWLEAAMRFGADVGRVRDEWSSEQAWRAGASAELGPAGEWPSELGWWTYLGPGFPAPPLPEVAERSRRLPNGALLITLLDDPVAVDPNRYESLHARWLAN